MQEQTKPFDGNGQPDLLSLINAEAEKVEPATMVSPSISGCQESSVSVAQLADAANGQTQDAHETSKEMAHLKAEAFTNPELPLDHLAEFVQNYIRTTMDAYGCPYEYVAVTCLVTAGIAAGKKVRLETNPYTNYACDYVCLVGKPSRNKTGPLSEVTRPLREYDKANHAKYLEEKGIYDQQKKADKEFGGDKPVFHQRVVGDSSPEARNSLLAQGDMIVIIADELKTFTDSLGRYSKGGNGASAEVSQILSIWSHVGFAVNRKTEDTQMVDEPAMSIIGGIQPALIEKTFGNESLMSNGFDQRFIFVYPDKTPFVKRCNRERMTQEMRDAWRNTINRLFTMEPVTLHLSFEAQGVYSEYADTNDIRAEEEDNDYVCGVIKKMNIHVLRFALMAHLLSDQWQSPVIPGETMRYAIRLVDYFTRIHLERIYPLMHDTSAGHQLMTNADLIRTIFKQFKVKSQNALAEALGFSQQYVNKVVNGQ